jgi:hypothetical protein
MESLNAGSWYWVKGKGPMQYSETREQEADPLVMWTPKGYPYRTKREQVGLWQSRAQLERYRTDCGEKGISLPPVGLWGMAEVDALIADMTMTEGNR